MTEIYLIRHGEAEGNVFRRIHGQYDTMLTPRGHEQVKCLEKRFADVHIDACYASDLTRTSLTARAIYIPKGLKLHRDPRFREVDLGAWEDLPFGYLDHFAGEQMRNFNHDPVRWVAPGAESYWTYTERFLKGMGEAVQKHEGGTIAIFAHGAVTRGVLARLFFDNDVSRLPYCDNTGVCKLIYNGEGYSYEYLNDNSHLPQELSTFALQFWWRSTDNRKDVNLYYIPYNREMRLPEGLEVPEIDSRGFALAAILHGEPVAVVSMAAPEGDLGCILGMGLKPGMDGRLYGDQLLGTAFSHFRRLGCRKIKLSPGWFPDDIFYRYAFDPKTRIRSIDTRCFDWNT